MKPHIVPASYPYRIEKGLPVPPQGTKGRKYPFPEMEVGDSFTAPKSDLCSVKSASCQYGRRKGWKFSTRVSGSDEVRCWRMA